VAGKAAPSVLLEAVAYDNAEAKKHNDEKPIEQGGVSHNALGLVIEFGMM